MSYRFMRVLVFFDLPTLTSEHQRKYRNFVKELKKEGFYMLQESVYVKMVLDKQAASLLLIRIKNLAPNEGNIMSLLITEKQFSSMTIILGEVETDVINDTERILTL